jgi:nucleotide-binding universal stress UspA family protein
MDLRALAPIIVAVDDAGSTDDAVDWAAAEAAVQHRPLRVVHALIPTVSLDAYTASAMIECAAGTRSAAEQLLRNAVSRATSVAPEITVNTALLDGTVAWALRREARAARLLVVGHHPRHRGLRGFLAGSVSGELAGRAPCPVIVVRHVVGPVAGAARVVVGVNRGRSSSAALGFAFRAARQRGIPLTIAYVCGPGRVPTGVELIVDPPKLIAALGNRAVAETITRCHDDFPEVPLVAKLFAGDPALVLIAESTGAAMLVIGPPRRGHRIGRLLGSTSQAVLEHAECPIAIVGQDHAATAPTEDARRAEVHSAPR